MISTNRDMYLAITALAEQHGAGRTLEDFLLSLRAALNAHYARPGITPAEFVAAIESGLVGPVPDDPIDPAADLSIEEHAEDADTAADIDHVLASQALDMRDAARTGALDDPHRYFGMSIERPAGARRAVAAYWYNWDPVGYLECATFGAIGGWHEGDGTGRKLVSGNVAVLTDDGSITSVPAAELPPEPVEPIGLLDWAFVARFLWCGQSYE